MDEDAQPVRGGILHFVSNTEFLLYQITDLKSRVVTRTVLGHVGKRLRQKDERRSRLPAGNAQFPDEFFGPFYVPLRHGAVKKPFLQDFLRERLLDVGLNY